jgi:hypothetical protein
MNLYEARLNPRSAIAAAPRFPIVTVSGTSDKEDAMPRDISQDMLDNIDRQLATGAISQSTYDVRRTEVMRLIRRGRAVEPSLDDRKRRRITASVLGGLAAVFVLLMLWHGSGDLGAVLLYLAVPLAIAAIIVALRPYALPRAERIESAARAERLQSIKSWEASYAQAHGGQAAPGGWAPALAAGPAAATMNGLAIASLVLSLVGVSLLGVIFGHVALGQIERTGQSGRALAVWGLVLGYLALAAAAVIVVIALASGH